MYKIVDQRKEKKTFQEFEWVRLSELLTPIYNFMRDKSQRPQPYMPVDFYKPSWHVEEEAKEQKKISLKEVRKSLGSKFIKDKN